MKAEDKAINGEWPEVAFSEIFDISSSKRVLEAQWKTAGVPFYRAREIVKLAKAGTLQNELFISEDLYREYQAKYGVPKPGDLMISAVGTLGACYVVQSHDRFYYKDASVLRFSPKQPVCSRFIQHAFNTNYILDQVHAGSGSTVGTYTISRANETRIPLPPLAEQRRIAEVLDRAETLRAKRRTALAELDSLTQSLFLDLFGDPVSNPKNLRRVPLSEVTTRITDGTHLTPRFVDSGVPFIFVKNVRNGSIDFETDKFISEEEHAALYKRCPVEEGDVLYTTVGATYGQAASVGTFTKFAFQRHLAHLKPDSKKIVPSFLGTTMQLPLVKQQADRWARGAAQPTINLKELREMVIPLPPISLQREFARRVAAVEALKTKQRASLAELDALFATLQHRAFRGDL